MNVRGFVTFWTGVLATALGLWLFLVWVLVTLAET